MLNTFSNNYQFLDAEIELGRFSENKEEGIFSSKHPSKPYINRLNDMRQDRLQWHQRSIHDACQQFSDPEPHALHSSFKASPIHVDPGSQLHTLHQKGTATREQRRHLFVYPRPPKLTPLAGVSLIESIPSGRSSCETFHEKTPNFFPTPAVTDRLLTSLRMQLPENMETGISIGGTNQTIILNHRLKPLLRDCPKDKPLIVGNLVSSKKTISTGHVHHSQTKKNPNNSSVQREKEKVFNDVDFIQIAEGLSGRKTHLMKKFPKRLDVGRDLNSQHLPRVAPNTPV